MNFSTSARRCWHPSGTDRPAIRPAISADAKTVPEDVKGAVIAAVEGDEICIPESIYELPVPVYPAKGEDLLPADRWMRKCTLDEFVFFTVKVEVE